MSRRAKGLVVLGSTGSIGTQTLDIVREFPNDFDIVGLACDRSLELLRKQVDEFGPRYIHCNAPIDGVGTLASGDCQSCDMDTMVQDPDVDMVVTATSGDVALGPTLKAIDAGKDIALANKETVVLAGEVVSARARDVGVPLLPLDSEPNAIWQCIRGEETPVSRLIITASGGAFRDTPLDRLADATPQQALKHPTWSMGQKITIDSATMMNKAFEVIEAHWLFDVPWEDIEIVIHPESFIHSMVDFVDGSVKAQISPPDMHLPIQYAMFYPNRVPNPNIRRFDPVATGALTFVPWETERYPCFDMAIDFAKRGGSWPAALSGANDAAVEAFLAGKIGFLEIGTVIKEALDGHCSQDNPDLAEIIDASQKANSKVASLVGG